MHTDFIEAKFYSQYNTKHKYKQSKQNNSEQQIRLYFHLNHIFLLDFVRSICLLFFLLLLYFLSIYISFGKLFSEKFQYSIIKRVLACKSILFRLFFFGVELNREQQNIQRQNKWQHETQTHRDTQRERERNKQLV